MHMNVAPLFAGHPFKPDAFMGPRSIGAERTSTRVTTSTDRNQIEAGRCMELSRFVRDRALGIAPVDFSTTCKIRHLFEHLIA